MSLQHRLLSYHTIPTRTSIASNIYILNERIFQTSSVFVRQSPPPIWVRRVEYFFINSKYSHYIPWLLRNSLQDAKGRSSQTESSNKRIHDQPAKIDTILHRMGESYVMRKFRVSFFFFPLMNFVIMQHSAVNVY